MEKRYEQEPEMDSMGGCLIRMFAVLFGPALLLICAMILTAYQTAFPNTVDIIYGVILILIVIARLIDRPPKPEGKPAEAGHSPVVKYSVIMLLAGLALWIVARFILSQIL